MAKQEPFPADVHAFGELLLAVQGGVVVRVAVLEPWELKAGATDAVAGRVKVVVLDGFLAAGALEPRPPVVLAASCEEDGKTETTMRRVEADQVMNPIEGTERGESGEGECRQPSLNLTGTIKWGKLVTCLPCCS